MRASALCFATVCFVTSPAVATPVERTPATAAELDQYAAREKVAEKLADFEGGRADRVTITTLAVILLLITLIFVLI